MALHNLISDLIEIVIFFKVLMEPTSRHLELERRIVPQLSSTIDNSAYTIDFEPKHSYFSYASPTTGPIYAKAKEFFTLNQSVKTQKTLMINPSKL
jgi:hypothetical protein